MTTDHPHVDPFGSYKAEWLSDQKMFDLFRKPAYFPDLESNRPCILVGGRGTGKTTVLKCLSYQAKHHFEGRDITKIERWQYVGLYHRINTNRVTAFVGPELTEMQWERLFSHYVNLLLCSQLAQLLDWHQSLFPDSPSISDKDCELVSLALKIDPSSNIYELKSSIKTGIVRFEGYLNNLDAEHLPDVSLQGQPVDEFCEIISERTPLRGKRIFFLIDEFENLLDYQQVIFNTLLKHAHLYSFKIGVREFGWRKRGALRSQESLFSPADFALIDINSAFEDNAYAEFATGVCDDRLRSVHDDDAIKEALSIRELLPGLSSQDEAELLGLSDRADEIRRTLRLSGTSINTDSVDDFDLFLAKIWAEDHKEDLLDVLSSAMGSPTAWRHKMSNYGHVALFRLKEGRAGIRKYYCGWDTYLKLSHKNIRYTMQLVDEATRQHRELGHSVDIEIAPETQTIAAQRVGRLNLGEMEGIDRNGGQITKLLLGLGRIFERMSGSTAVGPETNQFHFDENEKLPDEAKALLQAAVMHLAIIRSTATKLSSENDLRAYDYFVHPIYAPYFVFSYRKKRKLKLSSAQLLGLVHSTQKTIKEVLNSKRLDADAELPEQLKLFEGFYASNP
jgi:hypothetical protein